MSEHEWKSSARNKLIHFEDQLHEAVEAGIHTYSGQKAWSLGNALLYTFSVMTTTGNGDTFHSRHHFSFIDVNTQISYRCEV